MVTRSSHAAAGLALAAGLLALPACGKKKDTGTGLSTGPPAGYAGAPGPMPAGNPNQPAVAGIPAPPGPGPLVSATAAAPLKMTSRNNLKMIGLAIHNSHDVNGVCPLGIADSTGKIGLSWRVALLPFIEQDALYKQFKLDEPWDSEHNKKLIEKMPKTYAAPGSNATGYTYYRSFSGAGTFLAPTLQPGRPGQMIPGIRIYSVADGLSNTIFVAEAEEPVVWTKPDDLPFVPGKPPKLGGGVFADGFNALFGDGATRFLPKSIDPKLLSNLIQTNDGNPVELP